MSSQIDDERARYVRFLCGQAQVGLKDARLALQLLANGKHPVPCETKLLIEAESRRVAFTVPFLVVEEPVLSFVI